MTSLSSPFVNTQALQNHMANVNSYFGGAVVARPQQQQQQQQQQLVQQTKPLEAKAAVVSVVMGTLPAEKINYCDEIIKFIFKILFIILLVCCMKTYIMQIPYTHSHFGLATFKNALDIDCKCGVIELETRHLGYLFYECMQSQNNDTVCNYQANQKYTKEDAGVDEFVDSKKNEIHSRKIQASAKAAFFTAVNMASVAFLSDMYYAPKDHSNLVATAATLVDIVFEKRTMTFGFAAAGSAASCLYSNRTCIYQFALDTANVVIAAESVRVGYESLKQGNLQPVLDSTIYNMTPLVLIFIIYTLVGNKNICFYFKCMFWYIVFVLMQNLERIHSLFRDIPFVLPILLMIIKCMMLNPLSFEEYYKDRRINVSGMTEMIKFLIRYNYYASEAVIFVCLCGSVLTETLLWIGLMENSMDLYERYCVVEVGTVLPDDVCAHARSMLGLIE